MPILTIVIVILVAVIIAMLILPKDKAEIIVDRLIDVIPIGNNTFDLLKLKPYQLN